MEKRTYSWRVKLAITVGSLLFFLGLTEAGLRLAGQYYMKQTVTAQADVDFDPGTVRILCVGDSFTFGGRVQRDETYPVYLQEILDSADGGGRRYQVINQGICEYNSWQVLTFLPRWLEAYRPQIVIVLVGSSNLFNPWGFEWGEDAGLLTRLERAISSLRVAKMIRLIVLNLEGRAVGWTGSSVHFEERGPAYGVDGRYAGDTAYLRAKAYFKDYLEIDRPDLESPLRQAWYLFNRNRSDEALALLESALASRSDSPDVLSALMYMSRVRGDLNEAEGYAKRLLAVATDPDFAAMQAAFFYSNAGRDCLLSGRYTEAIDYFFEAIRYNAVDEYMYYAMTKAFDLQSEHDADYVVRRCRELLEELPELAQNPKFMNHLAMFENKQDWERKVRRWLEDDLQEIIELCRGEGAEVVFQTYPVSYPLANGVLAAVARKNSVPLADQLRAFQTLQLSEPREKYLFDDDHCTAEGHKVMARTVFETMKAEGVIQ